MGLFKKKKSFKELIKEKYMAKSLQELTAIIGGGLKDKSEPVSIDEKFWLAGVYVEKLIVANISEGGFGYKDSVAAANVVSLTDAFSGSVYEYGIYKRMGNFGGEIIQNYRLEFLKNYLLVGNTKPIQSDWARLIFKIYDDTQEGNTANGTLTQDNLKDIDCPLYNPWVYSGEDSECIIYKIKVAILFCDDDFVKRYGLIKGGKSAGKSIVDTISDDYITFKDVTAYNSKYEIENFLNDCQTIDG